jgi:hypothetical protein
MHDMRPLKNLGMRMENGGGKEEIDLGNRCCEEQFEKFRYKELENCRKN